MNRIRLDEDWTLCQTKGNETSGRIFKLRHIPCQVHDALIQEGIIENPNLKGFNYDRWIGKSDWRYEKIFSLEDISGSWNLVLEGLDTYADIYFNGVRVARNESAYMPCRIEGLTGVQKGENRLRLEFKAPEQVLKEIELPEKYGEYVPDFCKARVFRSGFHDFSGPHPDLVRIGIYGHIWLEQVKTNGFRDITATVQMDPALSWGKMISEISYWDDSQEKETLHYIIKDPAGRVVLEGEENASHILEICLEEPMLWWPRSHGSQNLYELEIRLMAGDDLLDISRKKIGFRRVERKGQFDFYINGMAVKLWGANLTQVDTMSGCYHKERMEQLLSLAEMANCNTLRIWGESEVLPDEFYEECDRRGILLWHDFYLGYNMYNEEEHMLELYREEAVWLVNRLKHHPSILMWCGGNEVLLSRDFQYPGAYCYGEKIFKKIYPEICENLDPDRYYHINCPSGGEWANDPREGDSHGYTHQWYVPGVKYPVFLSENARFSAPQLKTMRRMMEESELWPSGYTGQNTRKNRLPWPRSWEEHSCGEQGIKVGPVEHYYDADDAEALIHNLGASYSEYIKYDVERIRRGEADDSLMGKRRTKGHFLWKLNNCCNLISYGVIDYFNEPQMAYYALKRAYSPLQISFQIDDRISVWMVNDTAEQINGSVNIALFSLGENKKSAELNRRFVIKPDESKMITYLDEFGQFRKENILLAYVHDEAGKVLTENIDYVDIERHLDFPCDTGIHAHVEENMLVLSSEKFARCVELLGNEDGDEFGWLFEDNYFDLVPGVEKRIQIMGMHSKGKIRIKPYYDEKYTEIDF